MNIDDLTIGQAKKLAAFLAAYGIADSFNQHVGVHDRIDGLLMHLDPIMPWGPQS